MTDPRPTAILASHVFDGASLHPDHAVVLEGERIRALLPRRDLPQDCPVETLPEGAWLAPGFIDVQVNGGRDVLLNDEPTPEAMARIAAAHRRFGTTSLLPTLITDRRDVMRAAVEAAGGAVRENPSILGVHLEGPFISPERPGIHDPARIRLPEEEDLAILTGLQGGVTLVTLAPERMPAGLVAALARAGVRVSLGHSMATYQETRAAFAAGMTGVTHLFNAMRPMGSRDPGPIAAALENPDCFVGLIVDGEHVDPAMLRLALRGLARPMLVTDAMPTVGGERDGFTLHGRAIRLEGERLTGEGGTLAGAHLDMAGAVRNAVAMLAVPLTTALRMASTHPAAFLGLDRTLGRIAPGYRADLVAFLPEDIQVLGTWVAGRV